MRRQNLQLRRKKQSKATTNLGDTEMIDISTITTGDFKALFGRDFPYLPFFVYGKTYFKDDIVFNQDNFYISLKDDNTDTTDVATSWKVYNDNVENYIQDEHDLEKLYIIEEQKIVVHRALKNLNAEYRQVLWLIYFEELSNAEAAVIMKKTSRQMKNLVYRAKIALKLELEKEDFYYEEL